MERLIDALGKRYNNNPQVAFIQLGLLGHWGEWHTYPQPDLEPSSETRKRVIIAYHKAFPNKQLMVRTADGYAGTQDWIGFHDDMFPEDTDNGKDWSFLAKMRRQNREQNWHRAVVGGEMVPGQADRWLLDAFDTTRQMTRAAHFSWVGPYCPAMTNPRSLGDRADLFRKRSESLVRLMGYDFRLTAIRHFKTVKPISPFPIAIQVKNIGVAPFYYPWRVAIALRDGDGNVAALFETKWDIRGWQPELLKTEKQVFQLGNVTPGQYDLVIGIIDPWSKKPAIQFANDLPIKNGWTKLSTVEVAR